MNDRYVLQPSSRVGWWVATDTKHQLVCRFKRGAFNACQEFTFLETPVGLSPTEIARVTRLLADWLIENHRDLL